MQRESNLVFSAAQHIRVARTIINTFPDVRVLCSLPYFNALSGTSKSELTQFVSLLRCYYFFSFFCPPPIYIANRGKRGYALDAAEAHRPQLPIRCLSCIFLCLLQLSAVVAEVWFRLLEAAYLLVCVCVYFSFFFTLDASLLCILFSINMILLFGKFS